MVAVLASAAWFLSAENAIARRWGFSLDDSWIYATFARNIAAGRGYSFNPGEQIAGATGPLFALILALFHRLFGEVVWSAKIFGVLCHAGSAILALRAARNLAPRSRWKPLLTGLLVALSPSLLWGALSGMEIPLYLLLVTLGIYYYTRERWAAAALAWSVGVWVRPDGLLLALLGIFLRPKWGVRSVATSLAAAAPVLAAFVGFNVLVGGEALPNSVLVKTHVGENVLGPIWEMIQRWTPLWGLAVRGWDRPEHAILLLPGMAVGAFLLARRFPALAVFPLGLPIALAAFGAQSGSHARYLMPTIPFAILLGVEGLDYLSRRALGGKSRLGLILAAVVCLGWQVWSVERKGIVHGWNVENINDMQRLLAEMVRDNTSPGDTIAVNDVGAMGYFSDCYVVDLVGLVSPRRTFPENLGHYRPRFLVVFPSWYRQYAAVDSRTRQAAFYDPDSMYRYVPVVGAGLRNNTICSRDQMFLYARIARGEAAPDTVLMTWH